MNLNKMLSKIKQMNIPILAIFHLNQNLYILREIKILD